MIRALALLAAIFAASAPVSALDLHWGQGDDDDAATHEDEPPRPVVSVVVEDLPSQRRSFPGVVIAVSDVDLGFQTLGRLSGRPVDVGDRVDAGDILAELTPDDLQDNVRAAEAAVETATVTLQTAQITATRTRDLAQRNVASTAQLEQAERGLKSAEARLREARSELARAQDAEEFARLTAPFDGVVSAVFENAGAVVDAGTPVLTLSDIDSREAVIDLPEVALSALPKGTEMTIWLESDPERRSTATVTRIDPMADAATRTRRLHLKIADEADFRLNALIRAQRAGQAGTLLSVPVTALSGDGEDVAVWVVSRSGDMATVSRRAVETGIRMSGYVEITSGLIPGEEVVIRGVNSLTDGQAVGRPVRP
ncbi:efflux RND transporter periplasmic adaptor subunit [Paracoccus sediminicola]|uniref:efflux RND transporter periplasmic adaptor subunit n=1 Tax=Paracoccus sediminicola TaxID=3017783 RepID=UPI0022F05D70|nr:efflux RND transporter periplasmic adaptor subunit [Paracoccus sediminicola]WBU56750.1 efflux RND transporter periplasmic adaptor subunit [Paracoccus sediminicola]